MPGCERMNERVREPGGFVLPRPPAERRFATPSGKAELRVVPLPRLEMAAGQLVLMTIRSHDQFNTTVYSDDDRYRGIAGDRRVLLANVEDLAAPCAFRQRIARGSAGLWMPVEKINGLLSNSSIRSRRSAPRYSRSIWR